jgi:hypothetical protein
MLPPKIVPSSDEEFRVALEALRGSDLSAVSIDQVKEHIAVLLKGHAVSVPIFDPGIRLYRARKMSLPASLAEIGAPPPDKVLSDQRCNRAGRSLFYCSSARNAPFFEVHAQVGDHLVLSEWRTTAKMTVNHVGYTLPTFKGLKSTRSAPTWGSPRPAGLVSDRTRTIDEFFSSLFAVDAKEGQEHLYKVTIAITEKFIPEPTVEGAFRFDGLMYPTIPMNGNCENFALKSEFVERAVAFVKAEYLIVKQIEGMKMKFDILDFSNSVSDGKLEWKGRPGRWVLQKGEQVQVTVEQGEWIARDLNGNIVPID